jgi:UDP-2,4-diacetamido-2,4,6-trideoxy-beta-L-altropyranose hydrolase
VKVAIRADASVAIGSGHVVRCLTLADELAGRGARVSFICRAPPAHLQQLVKQHGHEVHALHLEAPAGQEAPQQPWPDEHQLQDAALTQAILERVTPDWLVVDHYGLDARWERQVRGSAARLLAIDDLGRAHVCDLLLDANFHRAPEARYAGAAQAGARLLLGPSHALLRPRFSTLRSTVQARSGAVGRLLVFLGGMDAGNATGRVLDALAGVAACPAVDVVAGAGHPALPDLQGFCDAHPGSRLHVQTDDMPGLLAAADAAIGAGGGATWERCCLGVPTLALSLARNQAEILAPAAAEGLLLVPDGGFPDGALLTAHVEAFLHNAALRQRLSIAGMRMVDGRGTARVVAAILGERITMRAAGPQDSGNLHAWRNAPAVREVSRNSKPIALEDHRRWFDALLGDPRRVLLIGEDADGAVGVVRFDLQDTTAEVSIYLAEPRLGQGLGPGLLRAAEHWLEQHRPQVEALEAEVLAGNTPSDLLFARGGYALCAKRYTKRIRTV